MVELQSMKCIICGVFFTKLVTIIRIILACYGLKVFKNIKTPFFLNFTFCAFFCITIISLIYKQNAHIQ